MASQGDHFKTEHPAAVPVQPPATTHDDLLLARRNRRVAVLLAVAALLSFAAPFVPDQFWTYGSGGDRANNEFTANVYAIFCFPYRACERDVGNCYRYYDQFGSDTICRVIYAQHAFAVAALVFGIATAAITIRSAVISQQTPFKSPLAAASVYMFLLFVLSALTATSLGLFINSYLTDPIFSKLTPSTPARFYE
ncbi:hypothetical protein HK405_003362 [Cladochytrium tenue]|nr:hypothetical protein HK405_003362 [Cladochytrium tenue]